MIATMHPFSLMDALLLDSPRGCKRSRFAPALDRPHAACVSEDDKEYHITLSVPGVRTADISASLEERTLRLTGRSKTGHRHAHFDRALMLPRDADLDSEGIKLVHEDGVLTVTVPKREPQRKSKKLVINSPTLTAMARAEDKGAAAHDHAYHATLAVPGVRTADMSAILEERTLRITGETKTEHHHASFDRALTLPWDADFDSEGVRLVHEDGVLTVTVPKREPQRKSKQLVINKPSLTATAGEAAVQAHEDVAMGMLDPAQEEPSTSEG